MPTGIRSALVPCLAVLALLVSGSSVSAAPKDASAGAKPVNAAAAQYGATVDLVVAPDGGGKDKRTTVEQTFDGNAHSRCVVWGLPYSFEIELCEAIQVDRIGFAHSDYANELAPKDLRIEFDDGTVVRHALELQRPVKRKPVWQDVSVGKKARRIKVTVESNVEGAGTVNYGGLAEIAVWTSEDLDERFAVPDHDPKQPTFVHVTPPTAGAVEKVTLPPRAQPGEHPCLLMTKGELEALRQTLRSTEKGRAALDALVRVADAACEGAVEFPDPKGELAQVKSRGDEVAKRHSRLSYSAGSLGMAYALTGEAKYARRAAEILVGYAQRYAAYPEHKGVNASDTGKIMAQRLSEAMWLIPQISAYDYVYDSGALSDADKAQIENELFRPCVEFIRRKSPAEEAEQRTAKQADWRTVGPTNPRSGKAVGNWLNFYAAATLMAGAVMGDRDYVDVAAGDFRQLLHDGIGEDGMWGEGAIGYQLFAVGAMVPGLEAAARQGIDLWSFEDNRIKLLFDSSLWYAYPDATAPGINDSGRVRLSGWTTMVYDYAYTRFGDERYAPIINNASRQLLVSEAIYFPTLVYETLPEPKTIDYPSLAFQDLGYAIMRGGDRYTLLKYGPHGGVHGHYDKLNLILFAGDELGGEPQFHRYEDALHREWTTQTVAHNTLTVDQRSQVAAEGQLLVFEDAGPIKVMRGQVADASPGVLMDRTVVVTGAAVVDVFHARSKQPRTWDRTLRFNGTLAEIGEGTSAGEALGTRDGYQHLKVARQTQAVDGWRGTWQTKVGPVGALVAGAKDQQAIVAVGPDEDHVAILRQQGPRADFGMAYALSGGTSEVRGVKPIDGGDPNVTALEVEHAGGKTTVLVARAPGEWKAAGWQSDARVLCVEEQGPQIRVLVTGGSFARSDSDQLRFDAAGNYLAEGAAGELKPVSQWTPDGN